MGSLIKYSTLLLVVLFVTTFSTDLSAKSHRRCSTSFSFNFLAACLAPPAPVYREAHYVRPAPVVYAPVVYAPAVYAPAYRERTVIYGPNPYNYYPAYQETVIVERDPYYYGWGY